MTVAQLIAELQKFPSEILVEYRDTDSRLDSVRIDYLFQEKRYQRSWGLDYYAKDANDPPITIVVIA